MTSIYSRVSKPLAQRIAFLPVYCLKTTVSSVGHFHGFCRWNLNEEIYCIFNPNINTLYYSQLLLF